VGCQSDTVLLSVLLLGEVGAFYECESVLADVDYFRYFGFDEFEVENISKDSSLTFPFLVFVENQRIS